MKTIRQMWILKHRKSNSVFVVEYGLKDGKVVLLDQGFTKGNVVGLSDYRYVKQRAKELFGK